MAENGEGFRKEREGSRLSITNQDSYPLLDCQKSPHPRTPESPLKCNQLPCAQCVLLSLYLINSVKNAHTLSLRLMLMRRRTRIWCSYFLFRLRSLFRMISIPSFSPISSPRVYCRGVVLNSAYTTCCSTRSSTTSRTILSKLFLESMISWITSNNRKQLCPYASPLSPLLQRAFSIQQAIQLVHSLLSVFE